MDIKCFEYVREGQMQTGYLKGEYHKHFREEKVQTGIFQGEVAETLKAAANCSDLSLV